MEVIRVHSNNVKVKILFKRLCQDKAWLGSLFTILLKRDKAQSKSILSSFLSQIFLVLYKWKYSVAVG